MKNSLLNSAQHIITAVFFTCFITYAELHAQAPGIAWQNTIGGNGNDQLKSLQQTADGGYILGGWSYSNISGDKTENSQGNYDYWVVKLDASGNIQWEKTIGGNSNDNLFSIQQTADGGYILGGNSNSNISGDKTENAQGYEDYWVVKLDASGNIQWQNTIGGDGFDYLFSLQKTADGGYILGGNSNSNISGDKSENSQGGGDYWVVKLDASGNIQWQNTIGGNDAERLRDLQQTADGGYILGGYSVSNISGDKTENSQGGKDYWVVKLDASGNIQWQNTIGGNGNDELYSLQQTTDGGYILGGQSISNISGDKTENCQGFYDFWVVKLDAVSSVHLISDCCGGRLHLYPNPVNTDLNIDLSKMPGSAFSLRLHTLVGTLVYARAAVPMPVGGIIELPVSDLPDGSYFLSISNEAGESVTEKVVVMHKR